MIFCANSGNNQAEAGERDGDARLHRLRLLYLQLRDACEILDAHERARGLSYKKGEALRRSPKSSIQNRGRTPTADGSM